MEQDYFTVEQAADYLQIGHSTMQGYLREGAVKGFRIAGKRRILIPKEELLKLLQPVRDENGLATAGTLKPGHNINRYSNKNKVE